MAKKFRSIQKKILLTIISTFLLFLGLLLIFNVVVLQKIREDFVFDKIEESILINRALSDQKRHQRGQVEPLLITSFKADFTGNPLEPLIFMDNYTRILFKERYESTFLFNEISQIIGKDRTLIEGKLTGNLGSHFFIVRWNSDVATVYLSSQKPQKIVGHEIFFILIAIVILCFLVSSMVAEIVTVPIKRLEDFSKEIAKKNWNVEPPMVNNDEIGLLTESLNQMKLSLKDAEEREHHFLQSTSHDLKTPVMIIKGYAQAIVDNVQMDNEVSSAQIIIDESRQLERKISQLLHLNTIGNTLNYGDRDLVRIDRILISLVKRFKVIRPEIEWNLSSPEIEITGNVDSLLIALENLIDNQLRFAKKYINISVAVEDKTIITISNDGPHFSVEDPNSLFNIYQKDKQGHFGLGLSIVKQVIESHGGRIFAENSLEDFGVVFTIEL